MMVLHDQPERKIAGTNRPDANTPQTGLWADLPSVYTLILEWHYACVYWLSFKQAKEKNGHVRKGEKGWPCIYWNSREEEDETSGKIKRMGFLRYYTLFNVEQTEGIEYPRVETDSRYESIQVCEQIVEGMPNPPEIVRSGTKARYSPSLDRIEIPREELFENLETFFSTLYHELVHSVGHSSRLNRPTLMEKATFGSDAYSKEELIAEMGAAYLCGHAGIESTVLDNSAAYIKSWVSRLKGDKTLVVQAASQAQKSSDYILGRNLEETVGIGATYESQRERRCYPSGPRSSDSNVSRRYD